MRPGLKSEIAAELVETGRLSSFKVFDAHGHMGVHSGIFMPAAMAEEMLEVMDHAGVEWLAFAHHDALQDQVTGNQKAQTAISAHPSRLLGYYAVNPNYPEVLEEGVNNFASLQGFAGYKILAAYYGTPITDPSCQPLWAHAHEEKLVVLLHTWGGDACAGGQQVEEIAARYSGATIIMGHSQKPQWRQAIELAQKHDNVYCELCAAYQVSGVVRLMVEAGIEDKILFGTDLPWFDPAYGIGCVVFSHISDTARYQILRGNAERIFARWLRNSSSM